MHESLYISTTTTQREVPLSLGLSWHLTSHLASSQTALPTPINLNAANWSQGKVPVQSLFKMYSPPKSFKSFPVYYFPWYLWLYKPWFQINFNSSTLFLPGLVLPCSQNASCTLTPLHLCSCQPPLLAPHPECPHSISVIETWQVRGCLKSYLFLPVPLSQHWPIYMALHYRALMVKNTPVSSPLPDKVLRA